MKRALAVTVVATLLAGCGGADVAEQDNPVRMRLEQLVAQTPAEQTWTARYNPTTCACPPLEVRVGDTWLRAELAGDPEIWRLPLAALARVPLEDLPVAVELQGRVQKTLLRTPAGTYAVRVDVARVGPRKN